MNEWIRLELGRRGRKGVAINLASTLITSLTINTGVQSGRGEKNEEKNSKSLTGSEYIANIRAAKADGRMRFPRKNSRSTPRSYAGEELPKYKLLIETLKRARASSPIYKYPLNSHLFRHGVQLSF